MKPSKQHLLRINLVCMHVHVCVFVSVCTDLWAQNYEYCSCSVCRKIGDGVVKCVCIIHTTNPQSICKTFGRAFQCCLRNRFVFLFVLMFLAAFSARFFLLFCYIFFFIQLKITNLFFIVVFFCSSAHFFYWILKTVHFFPNFFLLKCNRRWHPWKHSNSNNGRFWNKRHHLPFLLSMVNNKRVQRIIYTCTIEHVIKAHMLSCIYRRWCTAHSSLSSAHSQILSWNRGRHIHLNKKNYDS